MVKAKSSFTANEPVVVGAFVTWLLSFIGAEIIGHTTLVSSADWSTLSSILVPVISAIIISGIAWVVRKFVTPAWKVITQFTEHVGLPTSVVSALEKTAVDAARTELVNLSARYPELGRILAQIEADERTV